MDANTSLQQIGSNAALIDTPLQIGDFNQSEPFIPACEAVVAAAIKRDLHVCRCCGYASVDHQTTIVLEGSPYDVGAHISVCQICALAFDLSETLKSGSGRVIWLPEFSQAMFSLIVRELYVSKFARGEQSSIAQGCLKQIEARVELAKSKLKISSADDLAKRLDNISLSDNQSASLKVMPSTCIVRRMGANRFNVFPALLRDWFGSPRTSAIGEIQKALGATPQTIEEVIDDWPENPLEAHPYSARRSDELREWILFRHDKQIGEYVVLDFCEDPKLSALKVQNLMCLLSGSGEKMIELGHFTKTKIIFYLGGKSSLDDDTRIEFYNRGENELISESATLNLRAGVLDESDVSLN